MIKIGLLIIAISWTIIMIYDFIRRYRVHVKFKWFDYASFRASFVSITMCYISLGIVIWGSPLGLLNNYSFLMFIALGILFFGLYLFFNKITKADLNMKWKIKELKKHAKNPEHNIAVKKDGKIIN